MLDALALIVAAAAVGASMWLAWRALRAFCRGAQEAAHGATDARRRLWAYRMRISTLTGLTAVGLGVLAAVRQDLALEGALWLSGGMLAFGALAYASAHSAGRAAQRGDKREHVRARLRSLRWRRRYHAANERDPKGRNGSSREQRAQAPRDAEHRAEVRRALRTLGLPRGATDDEIKRAWRKQALRHHPDRHVSESEDTSREKDHAEAFLRARRAYETLTDRDER
jgi:DnaJ-domain-containing protein 1